MRESSAGFGVGSRSIAIIFSVKGCLFRLFLVPVVPPGRKNMLSQITMHKYSPGKRTPWTGQVHFCHPCIRSQLAVIEYIAVFLSLVGRRSRNITVTFAVDVAAIENSRRSTEYKIHCSLYITILIILPHSFPVGVECILKTEETAVLKIHAIGAYKTGNCLTYRA